MHRFRCAVIITIAMAAFDHNKLSFLRIAHLMWSRVVLGKYYLFTEHTSDVGTLRVVSFVVPLTL